MEARRDGSQTHNVWSGERDRVSDEGQNLRLDMAERHFTDMDVVMVSHGDSLQVLQTVLAGVDCAKHRSLPHLETCELRLMNP